MLKSKKEPRIIPFTTQDVSANNKNGIIEEGTLGDLKYKVYRRGTIHVFDDKKKTLFKKDCELFEEAIDKLNLNSLSEGEIRKIPGSGDNDTLIFTCKGGDIKLSLEKPEYGAIRKLKKILNLGKKIDSKG